MCQSINWVSMSQMWGINHIFVKSEAGTETKPQLVSTGSALFFFFFLGWKQMNIYESSWGRGVKRNNQYTGWHMATLNKSKINPLSNVVLSLRIQNQRDFSSLITAAPGHSLHTQFKSSAAYE